MSAASPRLSGDAPQTLRRASPPFGQNGADASAIPGFPQ